MTWSCSTTSIALLSPVSWKRCVAVKTNNTLQFTQHAHACLGLFVLQAAMRERAAHIQGILDRDNEARDAEAKKEFIKPNQRKRSNQHEDDGHADASATPKSETKSGPVKPEQKESGEGEAELPVRYYTECFRPCMRVHIHIINCSSNLTPYWHFAQANRHRESEPRERAQGVAVSGLGDFAGKTCSRRGVQTQGGDEL